MTMGSAGGSAGGGVAVGNGVGDSVETAVSVTAGVAVAVGAKQLFPAKAWGPFPTINSQRSIINA